MDAFTRTGPQPANPMFVKHLTPPAETSGANTVSSNEVIPTPASQEKTPSTETFTIAPKEPLAPTPDTTETTQPTTPPAPKAPSTNKRKRKKPTKKIQDTDDKLTTLADVEEEKFIENVEAAHGFR